ncbi:rho-N domain-containing protein 1, chloroplastic-like [Telopea speciosissima]|uniref:rho-N domain-containing protein 1, chloroplastic-like n=1 Tax=Telopea speciosissima TaxID=54955 RepID=UPI001CC42195|nr:rho-N domain-containing protein 1, chloroplastic-like [Telopea speciosissima]
MSRGLHFVSNNIPGYGLFEEKCLPCLGVSGKATSASSYSCLGDYKYSTQFKVLRIKIPAFASKGTSLTCCASSGSQRRNPDFSRQSKHGLSRGRNRQNQDNADNMEESELLSSKNGPLLSLSSSPRFQATTATPGPREKEIVQLFRKVQAQLRERAAIKEEKKNEAFRGQGKESDTVDSLLKLLRKHSVEQGKKSSSGSKDFNLEQPGQNSMYDEEQNSSVFGSNSIAGYEEGESSVRPFMRPASNFQRRSPVPRVKYQPVYSAKPSIVLESPSKSQWKRRKSVVEPDSEPELEPEPEPELETESEQASHPELETIFSDGQEEVLDVMSESESEPEPLDAEEAYAEILEEPLNENKNLSVLKLSELRSLAKSRGVKGYSKLKKGHLIELLSGE